MTAKPAPDRRALFLKARITLLAAILVAGAGAVLYRAFDLQVRQATALREMAEEQYLKDIHLAPKRGTIYDRNGAELACMPTRSSCAKRARTRRNWPRSCRRCSGSNAR